MRRALATLLAAGLAAGALAPATASAAPADGRAWEFVSPMLSGGKNVQTAWGWADGDHAFYTDAEIWTDTLVPARTPRGWEPRAVTQQAPDVSPMITDASSDMSRVVVTDDAQLGIGDTVYGEGVYVHDADGVTPVATWGYRFGGDDKAAFYVGGSDDKRTLYLYTTTDGVFAAPRSNTGLYRWRDGVAEPVDIDVQRFLDCPARTTVAGGGLGFGGVNDFYRSLLQTGVSADGETAVLAPGSCVRDSRVYPTHIYVVRDGSATDISQPLPGESDEPAFFQGMSRDGSRVFFTTNGKLVPGDDNGLRDLYVWDDGALSRISDDGVSGAIVSPDGSTAYYVRTSGAYPNIVSHLHAWRDGEARHVVDAARQISLNGNRIDDPTQTSYDGTALVLTDEPAAFGVDGTRDQVFRIGIDGAVACVSCPSDDRADIEASTGTSPYGNAGWPDPRMSSDGSTVAFETAAALVPQDTNGAVDVYVWRDGQVSLISSGTVGADALAAGISWDGDTVFFQSWDPIVPGTSDPYRKLYAARVGGGFPLPQPPAPCGSDCQGPLSPAPFVPVPGSNAYDGRGNVEEQGGDDRAPRLVVGKVKPAAQRRLAKTGRVAVRVRSTTQARVRATMRVRLGRRWARSSAASARLTRAGTARLTLTLSRRATRYLARHRGMRVRIDVRSSRVPRAQRATFVVRRAHMRPRARRALRRAAASTPARASAEAGSGRDA